MIYEPNSIIIPEQAGIRRVFPFKDNVNGGGADWRDDTVFYDVFYKHDNSEIICWGAPLLNLEGNLRLVEILSDGKRLRYSETKFSVGSQNEHNIVTITVPDFLKDESTHELTFRFNLFEQQVRISRNKLLQNKSSPLTLATLQKDYAILWIKDWLRWHRRLHGFDRIVLYDNGSRNYSHEELAGILEETEEGLDIILVKWDFPFTWDGWEGGANTGTWSPWPLTSALNHCYLKFAYQGWFSHMDIDDYLVAGKDIPLKRYLERASGHYHHFGVKTTIQVPVDPNKKQTECTFRDYPWRRPRENKTRWKYVCRSNMPFLVTEHSIVSKEPWVLIRQSKLRFFCKMILDLAIRIIRKIFRISIPLTYNPKRPVLKQFCIYCIRGISTGWKPSEPRRIKTWSETTFSASRKELIYDDIMIRQAEKHGMLEPPSGGRTKHSRSS